MVDLIELGKKAIKAAISEGAEQVDVCVTLARFVAVNIEKGGIKLCDTTYDHGIGVRAYFKGGMGFSSSQRLDVDSAIRAGIRAAKQAKQAQPDPDFVSLPEPKKAPFTLELCDKELAEIEVERIVELACEMIDAAKVSKDIIVNGGASCYYYRRAIVNSLGVEVESEGTGISFSTFCIVRRGDDVGSYYEWDAGRRLKDVDPVKVGKKAGETCLKFLGAKKVETKTMTVVFNFLPASSLIFSVLAAANAESVQRKRSFLVGKLGKKIAPEILTVYDDGTINYGLRSSVYDGEGVPKRRICVIDKGILKTYLHNSYTANKAKVENNACAVRGYGGPPGIGFSNVQISLGDWSFDEMIEETKEGIFISAGGIVADSVTGSVSTSIDFGFKIENGEIAYPIKGALIGGNILEILANIDAISKEYREEPGNVFPAIRVKNVKIAG